MRWRRGRARWRAPGPRRCGASRPPRPGCCGSSSQLLQLALGAAARGGQLALEAVELLAAVGDQLELTVEVAKGGLEYPALGRGPLRALELLAQGGAGVLGGQELAQLVERDPEQVAQAQDLAHAFDVRFRVDPELPGLAVAGPGEEPDLLVVAQRAGRGAGQLGDVADAQRRRLRD